MFGYLSFCQHLWYSLNYLCIPSRSPSLSALPLGDTVWYQRRHQLSSFPVIEIQQHCSALWMIAVVNGHLGAHAGGDRAMQQSPPPHPDPPHYWRLNSGSYIAPWLALNGPAGRRAWGPEWLRLTRGNNLGWWEWVTGRNSLAAVPLFFFFLGPAWAKYRSRQSQASWGQWLWAEYKVGRWWKSDS